ncbi:PDZ and LIM domain protein Zasp isoform X2 [Episyrphus balteatus]|uniref:PDZ and LIM domain protein Zasp isoform X2 n=1 Tax=Episyrphus balteatus TaxID=286459 RepID=UPI002485ACBA|nr:PDZ and LIM domain protein Zasp isoform X2 [Episyrphus balteatus]
MAQLMQIQLQRFDAQPWGFRLQGGTDFAAPLVVQKINSGSLAEQAGLLPGDAVIKINDVDVYNLRHKDAQDLVVRSGNNFIVTVQRGGMTWRPSVTPTGQLPSPNPHSPYGQTVTKTSLAHKQQEVHHIGSGYNNSARPFNSVNGNDGQVKSIVNKQYNTPVGIYSDETIAETLSAQAEVLAGGVLGINFKKNEKQYSGDKSEVLKFLQEEETGEHEPVQHHNPPQIINNHIPSQNQSNVTRHVKAPVDRPKPPSTGGLPTGQNICTECERLIVGVFVRIKDKNLHVECFKCATCGTSLKNQGYYNFNNKLYCDIHARLAASQNPPSGTEGYVPVPIKPNTKLSASTISAALNNIGYNGSPTNGTSTPLYSAPPSNIESTNISDLPLPPPPSPTQLQQFQIQDAFCNGNNLLTNTTLNNHSRTNSSLSTASSSSLSLSPYSSTNGINNNSSCSPINNNNAIIENSLNNHIGNPANNNNNNNNYNSTSTLSLDRFASSSSSSPGHSRQQSTSSSTGSGIITATDFQLPPPPPPPLPSSQQQQKHHQYNQIQQQLQQQQQQLNPNPNPMTINQSGKQNENDMNSNNRYASSGSNNPGSSIQTNGVGVNIGSGQGSAPSGGRADDSINSRTGQGQEGDQFQYVTCQGNVIRSVIPPGKGVSVNYKVNQGFARPYGAPAPAPAAAPKSPTSYPPPQVANQAGCNNNNNNNNWNQPRQIPVQHQQHQQQPASNMYATLPRSNAGPQEYEQHQYYECEGHRRVEEHRAASYFEEDTEIIEANRESRNSFAWPPPRDDSRPTPTAAPLYIAPPETQHVVPKPIQQKQVCQHEEETRLQQEHEEQQQMQWQSRSAPQLTGLRGGMNAPEIESSSDSYTSTCTTTTTTSEEYQRMYNAQVQAYQMQGYDQSGSELDYHMDMEVAAMQQQNEQCYLSSSECLSGRRSAQECVESLAGTLSTFRLVDMVREVTPSPIPPPKAPRHVEFNDEPQMEPDRKAKEPPKKEVPPKKEEEPQKPPKTVEPLTQQKSVEEPICVKETYKVCGEETKSEEEKLVVEDRSEILQSQRIFQPTPEIKIEIPPVKPIPPTNIPNPCPKEWISPMVRALTTAPDTPVHMVECLCPKPCDFTCQCNPETIEKEKQEDCQRKKEAERLAAIKPEPKPAPEPEPEPVFLRESPPKGSNITNAMTTAPDFKLQFAPNPNNEIPLPEESEPYLPPPIDMTPYEREDRRPKSPFLKALTTAPDTPYNPFGHDVCSQLLDLPTPTEKLSMVDALITAPDRPYTPLNPEKATLIIEEQKKAEEKKPYQFQVLSNDDTCEFSATKTEQRQTSAFANMTNVASSFQPSRDPLPPGAHRSSIVPPQQQSEYESQRRASQRNVSQMSSSTCCATSSSKSVQQQYQQQQQTKSTSLLSTSTSSAISKADLNVIAHEIDEMFEDTRVPFPPPSPLSHLKARASPSGLHKPDTIPQYQRNWTVLPTQRPCRTPEPHELRENVPLAFVETPASPTPAVPPTHARLSPSGLHHPDSIPTYQSHRKVLPEPAVLRENVPLAFVHSRSPTPNPEAVSSSTCCKGTCLNAQQQQKQQHQVHQQQQQQQSTIQQSSIKSSHTAASSSSTASRTMTRVSEQKQQQQYLTPTPTVPIIVEDRSGPVTMAFQSLDEHQPHDESYPPSRPYTPSLINKPAPIIPFYQTPEKLCFEECPATTGHVFDRRSVSPCPDRAKSPAPGPPPNPLSAIRAPRLRDSDLPTASPRTLQVGSITTGQSYLGAQQMQQQQQQQGQVLSHYQTASQSGSHSYVEKPEVVQQRQVGDLTIQKREKESRLAEEKKSQLESKTTSQVGNTQIERRRKVVEEYEHTQKAKTIEIRTGSSSSTTTSTTGGAITGADVRSSYGKTGFVANQARRLSGLEQEITNLTSQSQAISARAATLTETTFPQLSSPEPVSKFPIKTVLSPHYEPEPQKYVVSSSSSNKLVGPPPGFKQQQLSSSTQSSVSQKQQQQQTHSAQSSSSLAAVSSSCTLTNASATNQQQQSRPSAIPVPAYKPPPAPTHHAHHPQQPSAGGVGAAAGRCPVTGKVCSGAGSGAGSNVCRAPCSQSMQSQPSSNNNTYKPTASTGPAGFKPPQASQAPPQQMQSQQQPKQPLFKPNIPAVNVSNSPTSSFAPPPPTPSTQPAPGSGPSSNIGGKGKAFGATSAPKRGRGILNKAVESGVRVPLCSSCNMQIRGPFITALGRIWCPDHFMCVNANCRRPLQDVGFVEEKGDLYCEYCFEKYLAPTCSKCSGKIKGDCLNAIGRHFHPECFTCAHCGKLFGNTPFFLEEGMAYCEADWNELFTTKCFACGFPVEAGDRWVEALGNNYHSQCFNCTYCKKNLEGQSFYNKGGRPFCKNHAR